MNVVGGIVLIISFYVDVIKHELLIMLYNENISQQVPNASVLFLFDIAIMKLTWYIILVLVFSSGD